MLVVGTKPSQHAAHQDLAGYGGHDFVLSIRIKVLMTAGRSTLARP